MSRRKYREGVAKLLVERLLARLDTPSPMSVTVDPSDLVITDEECSLFDLMEMDARRIESKGGRDACPTPVLCGSKPITIRVPNRVLQAFRDQSDKTGTKYQTLMNRALRDAAEAFM